MWNFRYMRIIVLTLTMCGCSFGSFGRDQKNETRVDLSGRYACHSKKDLVAGIVMYRLYGGAGAAFAALWRSLEPQGIVYVLNRRPVFSRIACFVAPTGMTGIRIPELSGTETIPEPDGAGARTHYLVAFRLNDIDQEVYSTSSIPKFHAEEIKETLRRIPFLLLHYGF